MFYIFWSDYDGAMVNGYQNRDSAQSFVATLKQKMQLDSNNGTNIHMIVKGEELKAEVVSYVDKVIFKTKSELFTIPKARI